ncbi:endolytic transglycosylase MltG [Zwartia vadi]|uniref:endolytic transglycosylase MltG n=1 Tax=Zwartia vadi TaxID=3058168 RepID=UPI0025B3CF03|nr:endolytic transglycosylase MltG [Zwartia vadi]MDN3986501.1 endolytic transglycosylase MltG [Zwartia vadi]
MNALNKLFLFVVLPALIAIAAAIGAVYYWVNHPLTLPSPKVDLLVPKGATPASIASQINQAGIELNSAAFVLMAKLTELDTKLKAGGYQLVTGDSPLKILRRMAQGDVTSRQITLVEGWNMRQIRAALAQHGDLKKTLEDLSDADLVKQIGLQHQHPEGLFFPDTYIFPIGTTDLDILERAARAQQQILERAWASRQENLPLTSPYQALILGSIVEKETGKASDRARIAGVFINRLRLNMPLQTDPTVIYGMGEAYQGKIRKKDLQTDHAWNTYTRGGLPVSPISSVGQASLNAALNPEKHDYLYFVAKGDGTSAFARTLPEHNKNVAQYILGRKP